MTIDEILKLGGRAEREQFNNLFNADELAPIEKTKSWDELFNNDLLDQPVEFSSSKKNMQDRFNDEGFSVPEFSFLNIIPYYLLQHIDRKGKNAVGTSFMYNGEKIKISENIYNKAMEAINYLKSNFTTVDAGIKALINANIGEKVNAEINNYLRIIEASMSASVESLLRKAQWQETVEGFLKTALAVGPEDDLRDNLLHYLEKDEYKYRGKIKKYKGELERIKNMKHQLLNGASFEEINRGLEEPDFFDNTEELDQRLEDSKLNELSESEAYNKMLWGNK